MVACVVSAATTMGATVVVDHIGFIPKHPTNRNNNHNPPKKQYSEDHPDARAVMYETGKYNERKIRDFLSALEGLKLAAKYEGFIIDMCVYVYGLVCW